MEDTKTKQQSTQTVDKDKASQESTAKQNKLKIDKSLCISCATCAMMHPEYFEVLSDGSVVAKDVEVPDNQKEEIKSVCPVGAIKDADK